MLKKATQYYIDSFKGFNQQVWFLALITLINRAGTMVIPFMSLYLTEDLDLSLNQVGWIMSCFGLGSVIGSWFGGKLTDWIGYYPTMVGSLIFTAIAFVLLQFIETFEGFCVAILLLMIVGDTFRPAMFVALRTYSKPENRTRAVSLIRLAINLGFSAGPAIGGYLIVTFDYAGLFWVDGLTCLSAAILLLATINRKEASQAHKEAKAGAKGSPYKDIPYLVFLFAALLAAGTFLQFFSTVPIYFKDVHRLDENEIGLLLGLNGLLVFLIEMPFIKYLEQPKFSIYKLLFISTLFILMGFLVFNLSSWSGVLVISIIFMSIGELINFPFLNRFAMERADRGKAGSYMALFTMAFSVSHIFGHNGGMQLINHFGYEFTWFFMCIALAIASVMFLMLKSFVARENENKSASKES